jgi:outer membrane lipoprotein-sorting protein
MKSLSCILPLALSGLMMSSSPGAVANNSAIDPRPPASFDCSFVRGQPPADSVTLDTVLKKMDEVAATFHSAQASFEWQTYEKVIDETDDYETGVIYYRRSGKDIEMKADVKNVGSSPDKLKPEPKYILFSNGVIKVYQPKVDQVTVYDLGKKKADFESYLVLGFGGSGQELQRQFDVTFLGPETVAGVATAKLQLVPKSESVRNNFNKIVLWIDPEKGISVQQQFFTPQGDSHLSKYTDIQVNGKKIPDEVFKLKTTNKTQTISPRG